MNQQGKVLFGRKVWEVENRFHLPVETLLRYEKGTKKSEIARKLGVSRQLLGKWWKLTFPKGNK